MRIVRKNNEWLPSILDEFFPENRLDALNYETFSIPAVNIKENFSNFVLEVALPGLKKENIAIEIEKDVLKVSSSVSNEKETSHEEETNFTRKEFEYKSFKRLFTLPKDVNKNLISAQYIDGILSITLPKVEEAKDIKRMVEIS